MIKISLAVALLCDLTCAVEPNPPNWDKNVVFIFSPGQTDAQEILDTIEDPLSGKDGCNAGHIVWQASLDTPPGCSPASQTTLAVEKQHHHRSLHCSVMASVYHQS